MHAIKKIELFYVKIPLAKRKPGFFAEHPYFTPSWIPGFRQSEMRFYLLRLTTDKGLEGFSAMPAMSTERYGLGPLLGSYLLDVNPMDIQLVNQRIQEFAYIGMRNGWIEAAFWDLIGKIKRQPLYALLGGTGGTVYPYISTGSKHDHNAEQIKAIVQLHRDAGFRGIKLRVKSTDLQPMVDFVAAARATAGDEMALMVDANQGWPVDIIDSTPRWNVDFATRFARAMEPLRLKWLEEPLNKGNFEGLAQLRQSTTTPIAGGEMNGTWREFKAMLETGSLDVYQPDAILAGGTYAGGISMIHWLISEIRKRNDSGKAATPLAFCPHTWTTGLGFAVALQLVGVLKPEERSLIEYPFEGYWTPEVWGRFIKTHLSPGPDGSIKIPEAPGLGIEIDMGVIGKFGKRIYKGTKSTVGRFTLFDRGWKQTMYLKKKKEEQLQRASAVELKIPVAPF